MVICLMRYCLTEYPSRMKWGYLKKKLKNWEFSLADSNINLLMWAHYAAEHKGMCLEFHRIEGTELANNQTTRPISYTDNHPTLSTKSLTNNTTRTTSQKRILYAKSKHWAYEQEWRHIVNLGNQSHPWPAPLKAIYFGCKTEEQDIYLVRSIINDSKVKYFKAEKNATTFGITFRSI
ncbi:DUF2971 domain-containing protein [Shewanella gelidimarina]|uniref:DUF2971 domain-containing protein n=1 Tax=Shewanella gelidimarina TaxID=56813 RepID=UPI003D160878